MKRLQTPDDELDGVAGVLDGLDGRLLVRGVQLDVAHLHHVVPGEELARAPRGAFRQHVLDEDAGGGHAVLGLDLAADDGESQSGAGHAFHDDDARRAPRLGGRGPPNVGVVAEEPGLLCN